MQYRPECAWLTNACLNLTDACNLACRYCFVEQHPHYMSLDTAKRGVDFLVNNLHKKKDLGLNNQDFASITYFGGEPTLCWDSIIVPLTDWAKEKYGKEVEFSMTTNGTLLFPDRVKWLKEHNVGLLLSIDGAKPTQDYNRPCRDLTKSSFDMVLANIPTLLEYYPNITYRSTIYQDTVDQTFSNYLYAAYLGFKHIFMMPNCRGIWTNEQVSALESEYEKIYNYFIMAMRGEVPYIDYSRMNLSFEQVLIHDLDVLNNTLTKKTEVKRNVVRCGMGTGMGSIGYDGKIYGCQEQDSKDAKNIFCIGDLDEGINEAKHLQLLSAYHENGVMTCEDPTLCDGCPLCSQCETLACPSTVWDLYHTFFKDAKIHCQWELIMFEQAARVMQVLVAEDNQRFKQFLDKDCHFKAYWKEEE